MNDNNNILIKIYRFITLLNFIKKILELVIVRKLSELIKNNNLLPKIIAVRYRKDIEILHRL
jgi:hypothetical protein